MASSFVGILATTLLSRSPHRFRWWAQTLTVPNDVVIKLQRTSCYGPCPIYTVTIDAVGNVNYEGAKNVRVVGHQSDRIPLSGVRAILKLRSELVSLGCKTNIASFRTRTAVRPPCRWRILSCAATP